MLHHLFLHMTIINMSSPCGRALLRPGVIINSERIPGAAPMLVLTRCRNTKPLDRLAANRDV